MSEKIPELKAIDQQQREILMDYLKASSISAVGKELQVATPEEVSLSERLLSLNLPTSDSAQDRHSKFADSNYKPDVALRVEALKKANLEANEGTELELRRHDIAINSGLSKQLALKVINLIERNKIGDQTGKNVPEGIVFLGTINFKGNDAEYLNLTEEQREQLQKFLDRSSE